MICSSVNLLFLMSVILLKSGPRLVYLGTAWGEQVTAGSPNGCRMAHLFTTSATSRNRPRCTAATATFCVQAKVEACAGQSVCVTYGNSFKPSSFKKPLCLSFAAAIAFSISTSSWCVLFRSISASPTAVLM
jgi:hypothetical protein